MNNPHLPVLSAKIFPSVKLSFNNLPGHTLVRSLLGLFDVFAGLL